MQLIAAPTPMSGIATLFNLIQLQIEAITCNHDEIFTIQVEIHERHSLEWQFKTQELLDLEEQKCLELEEEE